MTFWWLRNYVFRSHFNLTTLLSFLICKRDPTNIWIQNRLFLGFKSFVPFDIDNNPFRRHLWIEGRTRRLTNPSVVCLCTCKTYALTYHEAQSCRQPQSSSGHLHRKEFLYTKYTYLLDLLMLPCLNPKICYILMDISQTEELISIEHLKKVNGIPLFIASLYRNVIWSLCICVVFVWDFQTLLSFRWHLS